MNPITVDAIFEDGVFRPTQPLSLAAHQRVKLIVQLPAPERAWPDDTAEIYREIEAEDRALAEKMFGTVARTWPHEEKP